MGLTEKGTLEECRKALSTMVNDEIEADANDSDDADMETEAAQDDAADESADDPAATNLRIKQVTFAYGEDDYGRLLDMLRRTHQVIREPDSVIVFKAVEAYHQEVCGG